METAEAPLKAAERITKFGIVVRQEPLTGGLISKVLRLTFTDGSTAVYKESEDPPPSMYACEAEGLEAMRLEGGLKIPAVLSFDEDHIVLEDLGNRGTATVAHWEEFGRRLALMHLQKSDLFGWHRRNYIGSKLVDNTWTEDGHGYFQYRVLRFLEEPLTQAILTPEDRRGVEHVVERVRELVPYQTPSLCHGDLWPGNILITPQGEPCLFDPAIHYGWPEADLALLPDFSEVPEGFWDAYEEVHPLEPGYRDRLNLLALRDALGMVAEFGGNHGSLERVRDTIRRYR